MPSGGTDLLRFSDQVEGRSRVVIVDAFHDEAEPGTVSVVDEADERQAHVHHLSVGQAIQLLKLTTQARFILLGVSVKSVDVGEGLSAELGARLPEIIDRVVQECGAGWLPAAGC